MEDSFEKNIKEILTNPPQFDFDEKPFILAKAKLDYDRKLRKYKWIAIISLLALLLFALATGLLWYGNRQDKNRNGSQHSTGKISSSGINASGTVYIDQTVYVHDTVYITKYITKKVYTDNKNAFLTGGNMFLPLINSTRYTGKTGITPLVAGTKPVIFKSNPLYKGYSPFVFNNSLEKPSRYFPEEITAADESSGTALNMLPSRIKMLRYGYTLPRYGNYSDNIMKYYSPYHTGKKPGVFKKFTYNLKQNLTVDRYELQLLGGGYLPLALSGDPGGGIYTGLNGKMLFDGGMGLSLGIRWLGFNREFESEAFSKGDFPPPGDNEGHLEAIYMDYNYFLLPLAVEYRFITGKSIYPYAGIGYALKYNSGYALKYELYDIATEEEYYLKKEFSGSFEFGNYILKAGINYDYNSHFGMSLEGSYLFTFKEYKYRYRNPQALMLSLNANYRF